MSNNPIIEIDGRQYEVVTTFDGSPAIYHASNITTQGHVYSQPSIGYMFRTPPDAVVILAKPVEG